MAEINLIHYNPTFNVLICKVCKTCPQTSISRHIRLRHKQYSFCTREVLRQYEATFSKYHAITSPPEIRQIQPPRDTAKLDHLKLWLDGILCLLCVKQGGSFVCRCDRHMKHHLQTFHGHQNQRRRGRPLSAAIQGPRVQYWVQEGMVLAPVACQSFFSSGGLLKYFSVSMTSQHQSLQPNLSTKSQALTLHDQVQLQLDHFESKEREVLAQEAESYKFTATAGSDHAGWLRLTEWPRFLDGHSLEQAARLLDFPTTTYLSKKSLAEAIRDDKQGNQVVEADLCLILESLDRNVQRARESLQDGKLNPFDQHRLNSFIPNRPSNKPFVYNIQENSYKKYIKVYSRLLCFVYRRACKKIGPDLHYSLTDDQYLALVQTARTAAELCDAHKNKASFEHVGDIEKRLDDHCLLLCISLLDHRLYGDIYDSIIVGFLAVLAIQETHSGKLLDRPRLCLGPEFMPHLSAIVKISQLLVAERAVLAVERDEADYPGLCLEEMQRRFMSHGTRSPICWVHKLRAYGKAMKDTTTSLGHIDWSDDGEILRYKDVTLTMTQLRNMVSEELALAQQQLADLLLVHPDEERVDVVPPLSLRSLQDNPAESAPGWSFIDDPRNSMLHGYNRWLLDRVLNITWLRNDFFESELHARWRLPVVQDYLKNIDHFLERILLLIHITSGQPARGTELLSVQHCNPMHGQGRRSIFLENGLVSFVTPFYKGYNASGSTKIIHRYLPIEVGELYVYYVWIILPFAKQLIRLSQITGITVVKEPYLWGEIQSSQVYCDKDHIEQKRASQPWRSERLSNILTSEFERLARTKLNIQTWRHSAIAISRRHLQQAKFKRDFIEAVSWTWNDKMAAHGGTTAGLVYARGLHEAPGHVAAAKTEYRRISREWHAWLGFSGYKSS